jgi:cytochrome c-type biogenesis protein CcmH
MTLWIILTLMVALAVSGLTIPLVQRHNPGRARATTVSILTAQLGEIDAQLAAGTVSDSEATALKTEIKRRILAEGREPESVARPIASQAMPFVALGLVAVVALAATILYALIGRPDLVQTGATAADQQALASGARPGGVSPAVIVQLEEKMRQTPNDAEGWRMLGWSYLAAGRATDAVGAYAHAVALDPGNAGYLSAEGDAIVQSSEGQVTPPALAAFRAAAKADPGDPRAGYFLALYKDQQGDHDGAMADWIALLKSAPADAAWAVQVRAFVEGVARERGLNIADKLPPRGASATPPVQSANGMSPSDRDAMIHAMVDRLAAQLKANPRNPEGWEQLMRARMVLGDTVAATTAYRDASKAFAGSPDQEAKLRDAARALGIPGA